MPSEDPLQLSPDEIEEAKRRAVARSSGGFGATSSVLTALDTPDEAASDQRMGERFGVPSIAVAGDREGYERRADIEDLDRLGEEAPRFRSWLDNPDNFAASRDDFQSLSVIERVQKTWRGMKSFAAGVPGSARAGFERFKAGEAGRAQMWAENPAFDPHIQGLTGPEAVGLYRASPDLLMAEMERQQEIKAATAPYAAELRRKYMERAEELAPPTGDWVVDGLLGGVQSLVAMAPSVATGIVTRNPTVPTFMMSSNVAGQEFGEARDEGLSYRESLVYGVTQGSIEYATERIPMGVLIGSIGKRTGIFEKLVRYQAAEQTGEQFATHLQDFNRWQTLEPEKTWDDYWTERPMAAAQTALGTLVAAGGMQGIVLATEAGINRLGERSLAASQTDGEDGISSLLDAAQQSKLRERHPEKFEALSAELLGEDDQIAIDLEGVGDALLQAGLDPVEVLTDLGVDEAALDGGFSNTGEIQIKASRLMASELIGQHRDKIEPHIKRPDDPYTPAQREREVETLKTDFESEVTRIREAVDGELQNADAELDVYERVRTQLEDADAYGDRMAVKANAELLTAMITTTARRIGMAPMEFYEAYGPAIQGVVDGQVSEGDLQATVGRAHHIQNPRKMSETERRSAMHAWTPEQQAALDAYNTMPNRPGKTNVGEDGIYMAARLLATDGQVTYEELADELAGEDGKAPSRESLKVQFHHVREALDAVGVTVPSPHRESMRGTIRRILSDERYKDSDVETVNRVIRSRFPDKAKNNLNVSISNARRDLAAAGIPYHAGRQGWALPGINEETEQRTDANDLLQADDLNLSTPEGRAQWVQDYTVNEVIPGEAVSSRMYGFRLEGIEPVVFIAPDTSGGATTIEWSFAGRGEREAEAFGNGGEKLSIRGLLELAARIRGILEADIAEFQRDAYVFTPYTEKHRKLYLRGLKDIQDYELYEAEDDIYIIHKDADVGRRGRVYPSGRPQPDASPEPGIMGETSPEARSEAFRNRVRDLPDNRNSEQEFRRRGSGRVFGSTGRAPGDLFQLIGPRATNADQEALARAKTAEASGVDRRTIWEDTGWFKGADGKWRFEISDRGAKLKRLKVGQETTVGGVLVHDALFEAYPELADIPLQIYKGRNQASYITDGQKELIQLAKGGDARSTLLHELQHAIQRREGFAPGSNFDVFRWEFADPKDQNKWNELLSESKAIEESIRPHDIAARLRRRAKGGKFAEAFANSVSANEMPLYKRWLEIGEEVRELMHKVLPPGDGYRRAAGEVEARNVQVRLRMSERRRQKAPPWETQDVDEAQVILPLKPPPSRYKVNHLAGPDLSTPEGMSLWQDADFVLQGQARGSFSPDQNLISLMESRNLSTFMHESAHWYLDMLEKIAATEDAPAFVKSQLKAIYDWHGVPEDFQVYDEDGNVTPEGRELHEAFAETFEIYLKEGKAPNAKLREAFRAFKAWLTRLYEKIGLPRRARLNPEIRAVFDRMLAADLEATAANRDFENKAEEMAQALLDQGVITERQFTKAKERLQSAREAVKEELMARFMADYEREQKAWWREEERRVKGDVVREFDRSPAGRAYAWLGGGVWKGDVPEDAQAGDEALMQARDAGYEGETPGEAREWLEARAKGLDMSTEARMARAREMGFDARGVYYHGTKTNFRGFDTRAPEQHGVDKIEGVFLTPYAHVADMYAGERGQIMPLLIRDEKPYYIHGGGFEALRGNISAEETWALIRPDDPLNGRNPFDIIREEGYTSVHDREGGQILVFDPSNIRSVHAAFDPERASSANILHQQAEPATRSIIDAANEAIQDSVEYHNKFDLIETQKAAGLLEEDGGGGGKSAPLPNFEGDVSDGDTIPFSSLTDEQKTVFEIELRFSDLREDDLEVMLFESEPGVFQGELQLADPVATERRLRELHARREEVSTVEEALGHDDHNVRAAAFRAALDQLGIEYYTAGVEGVDSEYIYVGYDFDEYGDPTEELKIRFADHENQSRLHGYADYNLAVGNLDGLKVLGEIQNLVAGGAHSKDRLNLLFQPGDPKGWGETAPPEDLPEMRLDLDMLREAYGDEAVDRLPRALRERGDGQPVTADEAASFFGFNTGEQLIRALGEIRDRSRFIGAETRRRLAAEFGDPFNDGTITEEARKAAESEIKARQTELELEALERAVGRQAAKNLAKQIARDLLATMTVREVGLYRKYLRSAESHGRQALEAVKRGDMATAMMAKKRELVAMHMYREGEKLNERIEKMRRHLKGFETIQSRRESIDPDYLEKIDGLLELYELRVSKQGATERSRRQSAAQFVMEMTAAGRESELAPEVILLAEQADKKVWRTLTADEAQYLTGTIDHLAHLGKTKNKLLAVRKKREFGATISGIVTQLRSLKPITERKKSLRPGRIEQAQTALRDAHARLTRMEFQFARLDGQENGPLYNALWRPFADAANVETKMMREAAERMDALYNMYSASERRALFHTKIETPEINNPGKPLTRLDVTGIALNWGNQYNREAVAEGYGWDPRQVEILLNRVLNKKDWDFVESVWDLVGSYRDEAFKLQKDITGVTPEAVKADPFTLANGRKIKGGYYPLVYDSKAPRADSVKQSRQDEKQALEDFGRSFSRPMTKTGHLKERVGSGGKPPKIDIGVMHEHVANVIHDIAYRRAVLDAHRIVSNEQFTEAYIQAAGRDQYDQLLPWIADIANERRNDAGGLLTKILMGARRNSSIMFMGWKVGTMMQQITGFAQGAALIGSAYSVKGFAKAIGRPTAFWGAWQEVSEKSEFMRDRPMGFDRDMREVTNRMQERTPLGPIQRNAFLLIGLMDTAVSTAVWIGAYDKAMDGKVKGIEAGVEGDAIEYADSVIRRTQVAGRVQDLPRMMRGTELEKLLTMIYSYFSGLYNLTAQQFLQVRQGNLNPASFAANAFLLFAIVPIAAELLAGRFPPDEDDEEPLDEAALRAIASNAVSTVPVIRDMMNAALRPEFGYAVTPTQSTLERGIRFSSRVAGGEPFESEAAVKDALSLAGVLFGLPTGQMWITGEYIYEVAQGEEDPMEDPAFAVREAVLRDTR